MFPVPVTRNGFKVCIQCSPLEPHIKKGAPDLEFNAL